MNKEESAFNLEHTDLAVKENCVLLSQAVYEAGGSRHAMHIANVAQLQERSPLSFFKSEIVQLTGVSERTAHTIIRFFSTLFSSAKNCALQKFAHGDGGSLKKELLNNNPSPTHGQGGCLKTAFKELKKLGWGKRADGYQCYTDSQIAEWVRSEGPNNVLYAIWLSAGPNVKNRCAVVRTRLRGGVDVPEGWEFPTEEPVEVIAEPVEVDAPAQTDVELEELPVILMGKMAQSTYDLFFSDLIYCKSASGIDVWAPSEFLALWLRDNKSDLISEAISDMAIDGNIAYRVVPEEITV